MEGGTRPIELQHREGLGGAFAASETNQKRNERECANNAHAMGNLLMGIKNADAITL